MLGKQHLTISMDIFACGDLLYAGTETAWMSILIIFCGN